ncbi:MAG: DUF402 domain-containing protein [Pyrinomonadaceae bacterium]
MFNFGTEARIREFTINSLKYDGSKQRGWKCSLVRRCGPLLEFVGAFDEKVDHKDLGLIRRGTVSYEYYWLDRWYSVFRFHEPAGALRNYYCNINMPPVIREDSLEYVDLDIDVLVQADMSYNVLDREDFLINAARYQYPAEVIMKVEESLLEVIGLIENRQFPFSMNAAGF